MGHGEVIEEDRGENMELGPDNDLNKHENVVPEQQNKHNVRKI